MKISTTDGREYWIPDFCAYCNMDTAGNHEVNCPCANLEFYKQKCDIKQIDPKHRCHLIE